MPSSRGGVPVLSRADGEAHAPQARPELAGGRIAHAAGRVLLVPDVDHAVEKGAGRQHQSARPERPPIGETDGGDPPLGNFEIAGQALDERQIFSRLDLGAHRLAIEAAVGLSARSAHRRTLGAVEHAELNAGGIGDPAHEPVERVDLAHEMALAEPADRRIAGHDAEVGARLHNQRCARAESSRGGGRLAAGVSAANDDDVEGGHGVF